MKHPHKLLTASLALAAFISFSSGTFAGGILKNEHMLGNNNDGVDAYRIMQDEASIMQHPAMIKPAAGSEGTDLWFYNDLGNNPDGTASYNTTQQRLQWEYMKQQHPAMIKPSGGGYGYMPSQGTYNRFTDDPFGDIEE